MRPARRARYGVYRDHHRAWLGVHGRRQQLDSFLDGRLGARKSLKGAGQRFRFAIRAVPEPAMLSLLTVGPAGLIARRRVAGR
jgi:hypothetical protein